MTVFHELLSSVFSSTMASKVPVLSILAAQAQSLVIHEAISLPFALACHSKWQAAVKVVGKKEVVSVKPKKTLPLFPLSV